MTVLKAVHIIGKYVSKTLEAIDVSVNFLNVRFETVPFICMDESVVRRETWRRIHWRSVFYPKLTLESQELPK